jgi:hypothetical protein
MRCLGRMLETRRLTGLSHARDHGTTHRASQWSRAKQVLELWRPGSFLGSPGAAGAAGADDRYWAKARASNGRGLDKSGRALSGRAEVGTGDGSSTSHTSVAGARFHAIAGVRRPSAARSRSWQRTRPSGAGEQTNAIVRAGRSEDPLVADWRADATACRIAALPTQCASALTAVWLRVGARVLVRATIEMSPKRSCSGAWRARKSNRRLGAAGCRYGETQLRGYSTVTRRRPRLRAG